MDRTRHHATDEVAGRRGRAAGGGGEPKLVLIVAPHTSAWDFIIGLAAKWALRLETSYLAKESCSAGPFRS